MSAVADLLERATAAGDPPAAACCVIEGRAIAHESAHGASPDGARATLESVFDVASITKVVATTTAVAVLVARREIGLDDPVRRFLPAFAAPAVTIRELLGHRSGLPAWRAFFVDVMRDPIAGAIFGPLATEPAAEDDALVADDDEAWDRARRVVLDAVFASPLEVPGRRVYSDLGFITLGALVEAVTGARLDVFCADTIWRPLGLAEGAHRLGFADLAAPPTWLADRHVLPTGRTRPREPAPGQEVLYAVPPQTRRPDAGRVDDDNAFALGGVAGHAGVFGTARAVARFGAALIEELDGAARLGCGDALRAFAAIDPAREGSPRALGFDVPTGPASSLGRRLGRGPRGAIGHLGFTGCSLWLDLDRGLAVALLTNRTYPGRHRADGIRALRPTLHDAVAATLDP